MKGVANAMTRIRRWVVARSTRSARPATAAGRVNPQFSHQKRNQLIDLSLAYQPGNQRSAVALLAPARNRAMMIEAIATDDAPSTPHHTSARTRVRFGAVRRSAAIQDASINPVAAKACA